MTACLNGHVRWLLTDATGNPVTATAPSWQTTTQTRLEDFFGPARLQRAQPVHTSARAQRAINALLGKAVEPEPAKSPRKRKAKDAPASAEPGAGDADAAAASAAAAASSPSPKRRGRRPANATEVSTNGASSPPKRRRRAGATAAAAAATDASTEPAPAASL